VIIDTFMINNELDMLQCRLEEIGDAVDYMVAVEANVDHQDHPKPYHLTNNLDRFADWKDKLVVVRAKDLPTARQAPDPWAREHAQREWVAEGLSWLGPQANDVILHGDIDEIPTAVVARNIRPQGFVTLEQRGHFWSCRWLYPQPWPGTVAARVRDIRGFAAMRTLRTSAKALPNSGWHLSWLGGAPEALRKVGSFCHPEVEDQIREGLHSDRFLVNGIHVDGKVMTRVEIDDSFPRYVREGRCPKSWLL
jgi:beta-1,4-mannosyl-glycoprotein beta-1,4-N-acetylglucosaminyltransferase